MRTISARPRRRSSSIRTSPPCRLRRLRQICGHEVLQPDITGKVPGYLLPSAGPKFTEGPSDLASISKGTAADGPPRRRSSAARRAPQCRLLRPPSRARPRQRGLRSVERLGHRLQGTSRGLGAGPCYMASAIPQRISPQAQRTSSATPVHRWTSTNTCPQGQVQRQAEREFRQRLPSVQRLRFTGRNAELVLPLTHI